MKKVFKILTLIMLIFTIFKISNTFAKYYSEAKTETLSQQVAQWVIKINELDIYSAGGETVEFEVNKFNNFTNANAAPNKIAPASEGYTDIIIDPKGTDVAVKYDIELDLTGVTNLAVSARLEMASGTSTLIRTGENTYSGIITLEDVQAEEKQTIRCYITWSNDETKNEDDTALGTNSATASGVNFHIEADVTLTQYLGEEIVEYVES